MVGAHRRRSRSARARRAGLVVAGTLAALTASSPAAAGTYTVVACDAAPGAVNNSWRAREHRGMLAETACPTRHDPRRGLVVRNRINSGTVRHRRGAFMSFEAPAGARLERIRFDWDGRRVNGDWTLGLVAGNGRLISGCRGGRSARLAPCRLGDPGGADRRQRALGGRRSVRIEASCALRAGCATTSSGRSGDRTRVRLALHDPAVVVADASAPSVSPRGSALARGWQRGRRKAILRARDNVGIRSTALRVDGRVRGSHRSRCDFTRRRPCPALARGSHSFQTLWLADGRHRLALTATDSAGNVRRVERTIRVDNHAPRRVTHLRLAGGDGTRTANSFDLRWTPPPGQVAPLAGARYRLCRAGERRRCVEGWRPRAVHGIRNLAVPGRGDWRFRVWLQDQAGNANRRNAAGPVTLSYDRRSRTRLTAGIAGDGDRAAKRTTVRFGAHPAVRGSLFDARGGRVGHARLEVVARRRGSDRFRRIATARTDRRGRYRMSLPSGPSRTVRVEYRGDGRHRPSRATAWVAVRARSSISVSRRRVSNGDSVRFKGRLLGGWVPHEGKLVQLEAFYRGRWRPFEVLRSDRRGSWRHRYRFEATSGRVTYPFRVWVPRERGYPYAAGNSRVVRVTVDG